MTVSPFMAMRLTEAQLDWLCSRLPEAEYEIQANAFISSFFPDGTGGVSLMTAAIAVQALTSY